VKVFIFIFWKKEMTFLFEPLELYASKETCMVPEKEDLLIYSNQSILSQKITFFRSACR
jgi:hypothetical protein